MYAAGNTSKTAAKPASAISVQAAAISPSPHPTAIPARRPELRLVWTATSSAGPGLNIATSRVTLKASNCASVMAFYGIAGAGGIRTRR